MAQVFTQEDGGKLVFFEAGDRVRIKQSFVGGSPIHIELLSSEPTPVKLVKCEYDATPENMAIALLTQIPL